MHDQPANPEANDLPPIVLGPYQTNTVYQEDCVEALRRLPDRCVDLAIADPPYNLSKGSRWTWDKSAPLPGMGGAWSKTMAAWDDRPLADYLAFTLAWLRELQRVVKPTGSLWTHGTYHNMGVINFAMQLLQIEIINEVIWYKRNSFPNLSGRRLTASHETILWAHTGRKREYLFNYEAAKALGATDDQFKTPGKQLRTVWDIPNNKQRDELAYGKHPTQKPLRLIHRMLAISAKPGAVVLVPFAGAGSECIAAREFGAHFLGFETDPEFVALCHRRLNAGGASTARRVKREPVKNAAARLAKPTAPPLLKWTGSKRAQAASIVELLPEYRRYIEPFLGGGAVLYLAASDNALAGDIYPPLIEFWKLVQNDPELLADDYERQWRQLQEELKELEPSSLTKGSGLPRTYYEARRRFNEHQSPLDLNFLMRTCVNGIVRFNDRGEFNNSFHLSRRGMAPARFRRALEAWRRVVGKVTFVCQDYEATVSEAQAGDFVYLDPPYAGNRQRYVANLDLERFFGVLEQLNRRNVRWALSFDGRRGDRDLTHRVPAELYCRQLYLANGNSAVHKVLNGPIKPVYEALYLNY